MKTCLLCSCAYSDDVQTCGLCGEETWSATVPDEPKGDEPKDDAKPAKKPKKS